MVFIIKLVQELLENHFIGIKVVVTIPTKLINILLLDANIGYAVDDWNLNVFGTQFN